MLKFTWLKTFSTLTDTKSFTETAHQLAMTQPGVSQHIRKLEDNLGQQLIIRKDKHFELTPQGKSVLEYTRQTLEGERLVRAHINDTNPHRGKCFISSPGGVGTLIYPWLLDIQQRWPDLHIHFIFNPTEEVEQAVRAGDSDIGFITHATTASDLNVESVSKEQWCLVLPGDAEFENFSQLESLGFIDHPDARLIASEVLPRLYKGANIDIENLKTSGYINHVGMICEPVARGAGYTVLHENITRLSPVFDQLKIVTPKKPVTHDIDVIYKNSWPLHPRYQAIIDNLQSRFKEQC
ncbi:MAG: LysR family transcriptional regulator [Gammaproteobacteria bacterium]|nr:LysR family transcriptional regulator [Gammaproteobacteria bacterium]